MSIRYRLTARIYMTNAFALAGCLAITACVSQPAQIIKTAPTDATKVNPSIIALPSPSDKLLVAVKRMEAQLEAKQIPQQLAAQTYARTGDERGTLEMIDKNVPANTLAPLDVTGYTVEAAVDAIVAAAKNRQIVMLNENHMSQRQRGFALHVARALRQAGFTHFGAETFRFDVESTLSDGIPKTTTGVYTEDPLFGDLVRQNVKLGYKVFAYERTSKSTDPEPVDQKARIATREQGQAENIKAVLAANPNARMFIYVGGGHASKVPSGGHEWMGLRLKRITGIDPLTIDQNLGTPSARPERDGATYRGVASLGAQSQSIVLKNAKGEWLSSTGHDISVFHPRVPDVAGRPGWLTMNGYRKPIAVKFAASPVRTLVLAHVQGEPANAIAMDQIIVPANQTEVTLMLPIGKYVITREDEAGRTTPLPDVSVAP